MIDSTRTPLPMSQVRISPQLIEWRVVAVEFEEGSPDATHCSELRLKLSNGRTLIFAASGIEGGHIEMTYLERL